MQRLEKFFGKDNIEYNRYSTPLLPLETVSYRFYLFISKVWKERIFTLLKSEFCDKFNPFNKFNLHIRKLDYLDYNKLKIKKKIYTKQELIKELEKLIEN